MKAPIHVAHETTSLDVRGAARSGPVGIAFVCFIGLISLTSNLTNMAPPRPGLAPPTGDLSHSATNAGLGLPIAPISRLHTTPLDSLSHPGFGHNQASWLAYDPVDRLFFVAVSPNTLDVLSGDAYYPIVLAEVPVGTSPFGVAYDSGTGDVFVANNGSDNVSVVSAHSYRILASVNVGHGPMGVAYDPRNGDIYVADQRSNSVSVISDTTYMVVATVPVGSAPLGVAVDSATGHVYVANHGSSNVSVISDTTNRVIDNLSVPSGPYGVAVDDRTNDVYVTDEGAVQISAISDAQAKVVANYSLPAPPLGVSFDLQGIAFDSGDGQLYVGAGWAYLVVLNTNGSVHVGVFDPSGVVYDPNTGEVCATNSANATFECAEFFETLPTGPYTVTFKESGLAPNTTWWYVDLNGELNSSITSATLGFHAANGTYPFAITTAYSLSTIPTPRSGFVSVHGANVSVNVTIGSNLSFPVYVQESGLPIGTTWDPYVCDASNPWTFVYDSCGSFQTTNSSTTISLINGTYQVAMPEVAPYVASPASGLIVVDGGPVWINVSYSIPTYGTPSPTYPITFSEAGLGPGASWQVNLSGTSQTATTPSMTFDVPNGSYGFAVAAQGYAANVSQGTVNVSGAPVDVSIGFSGTAIYRLTFEESGLPNGTAWGVLIGSQSGSSIDSTISFDEPNGSYGYLIVPVNGYVASNPGPAVVHGSNVVVLVSFHRQLYPIVFIEIGLPAATNWTVTVTNHSLGINSSQTTATSSMTFFLPNGTFVVNVTLPSGYSANLSSTTFTVEGRAATGGTVTVQPPTSPTGPNPAATGGGLPAWLFAGLAAGLVAAFIGGWATGRLRRARPPSAPPSSS